MKEQQIEFLVNSLPGIGSSRVEQERRLRELDEVLRAVEGVVGEAGRVKEELVRRVEGVIRRVRRV